VLVNSVPLQERVLSNPALLALERELYAAFFEGG
jgi:hypothetical protein